MAYFISAGIDLHRPGPPARTTPDVTVGAHHHATQLVDLPINTCGIAMPCAPWSYRLAIL
jgi:hypothetical protein